MRRPSRRQPILRTVLQVVLVSDPLAWKARKSWRPRRLRVASFILLALSRNGTNSAYRPSRGDGIRRSMTV